MDIRINTHTLHLLILIYKKKSKTKTISYEQANSLMINILNAQEGTTDNALSCLSPDKKFIITNEGKKRIKHSRQAFPTKLSSIKGIYK